MTLDPIRDEGYATFLTEAQDILKRIEQDLLCLREDRSPDQVHRLMRSAHTLKGAAASVELDTIKQVAHVLEDVFRALYNPDISIDAEVEAILFEGYECLRLSLMAEVSEGQLDRHDILDRASTIITKLQEKLGDDFDLNAPLPTSIELGFDVVQSMFEVVMAQRLQELEQTIHNGSVDEIASEVRTKADIFLGLAESLNLPGLAAIAQATLAALTAHPDQIHRVAELALEDFVRARAVILAGDRALGGTPSAALQVLSVIRTEDNPSTVETLPIVVEAENDVTLIDISGTDISPDISSNIDSNINLDINSDISSNINSDIDSNTESPSLDDLFGEINTAWEATTQTIEQPDETPAVPPPRSSSTFHTLSSQAEPSESLRAEPVRVDVEQLKHLDYLTGELLINQSKQTNKDQQLQSTVEELRSSLQQQQQTLYSLHDAIERLLAHIEYEKSWQPVTSLAFGAESHSVLSPLTNYASTATFDALEMERYSHLRTLMRTALNETAQLEEITESADQLFRQSKHTLDAQRRVLRQVRDDLTALRMHPLENLLNRFPRLLQQLAAAHHKQVKLTLSGTHVLVDKTIAEKLYDPILHLIRNAFDHGIEPPEVRRAQGKSEVGQIEIRANQQGNQTVIEIKDDGRGIDLQRVAQRAIELQFITAEQISTIPESQLLDLLFQPGFSTVTQVSDLSGRGIGLNIVGNELQAMNGSIAVSTVPQQGTSFILKIPLSLTTAKLIICQAQGFAYALPVERIEQIVFPSPDQLKVLGGEQLVMQWCHQQEEKLVSLYSLSTLVQYTEIGHQIRSQNSALPPSTPSQQASKPQHTMPVLLLETIYGYRGLMVDRILGEQELVVRTLGAAIAPPPYIYGCCLLGDSRSALAIDVEVLMQLTTEVESLPEYVLPPGLASTASRLALSLPSAANTLKTHRSTEQGNLLKLTRSKSILIIDDSLTLRHNLTHLLKQVGYSVFQAGDGLEALSQLPQLSNLDLILCDLEMPRLNGFEFMSQLTKLPSFAHIPVVVLTSRSSAKHRQVALALGAIAYLTKPYDPNELLSTIDSVLQRLPLG